MGRHDFFSRFAPRPSRLRFAVTRVAVFVLVLIVLAWIGLSILLAPPPGSTELETVPLVSEPSAAPPLSPPGQSSPPGSTPPASAQSAAGALTVHVVGAVKKPGVYVLAPGSRIIDAVEAAGGMAKKAAPEQLNLAAPLTDGQQVVMPRAGKAAGGDAGQPPASASPGAGSKVSLNTADAQQLQQLPGIGPSLAARIIEFRTKNGPFTSLSDLDAVSGIGPSILANIEGLAEP